MFFCSTFLGTTGTFAKTKIIIRFSWKYLGSPEQLYFNIPFAFKLLFYWRQKFLHGFTFNALTQNFVMIANFYLLQKNFRKNVLAENKNSFKN